MFTVNGIDWNLAFVSPSDNNLMRSDRTYTLGVTDNNVKAVFVNNMLTGRLLDKVICHELTHVFSFSHNLHIPIETEEIIADFLATYGRYVFAVADGLIRNMIGVAV